MRWCGLHICLSISMVKTMKVGRTNVITTASAFINAYKIIDEAPNLVFHVSIHADDVA